MGEAETIDVLEHLRRGIVLERPDTDCALALPVDDAVLALAADAHGCICTVGREDRLERICSNPAEDIRGRVPVPDAALVRADDRVVVAPLPARHALDCRELAVRSDRFGAAGDQDGSVGEIGVDADAAALDPDHGRIGGAQADGEIAAVKRASDDWIFSGRLAPALHNPEAIFVAGPSSDANAEPVVAGRHGPGAGSRGVGQDRQLGDHVG